MCSFLTLMFDNFFIPSFYNATTEPACGTRVLSTTHKIVIEDPVYLLELISHCERDELNYVLAT